MEEGDKTKREEKGCVGVKNRFLALEDRENECQEDRENERKPHHADFKSLTGKSKRRRRRKKTGERGDEDDRAH